MHSEEIEELYRVMSKKERELYCIAADSPAEVIWAPDNINGLITNPKLLEKYVAPFYNEVTSILHRKAKLFMVHMDGKLRCLLNSIKRTKIDIVEGFTPLL